MTILQHTARYLRLLADRMDPSGPRFKCGCSMRWGHNWNLPKHTDETDYDTHGINPNARQALTTSEPDYEDEHNWGERPV